MQRGNLDDLFAFLAVGKDTNGNYALWEAVMPPGPGSQYGRQTQIACGLKSLSRVGINPCKRVTDFSQPITSRRSPHKGGSHGRSRHDEFYLSKIINQPARRLLNCLPSKVMPSRTLNPLLKHP